MMNSLQPWLQQLAYAAPLILVSLVGLVVALTKLSDDATPAILVLSACVINLLIGLAVPVLQMQVIRLMQSGGGNATATVPWMALIGVGASLLRALATGLLLVAAFVGRNEKS